MNDQVLGNTIMPGVGSYVVYWKKQSDDWVSASEVESSQAHRVVVVVGCKEGEYRLAGRSAAASHR
jgi:hypothetical protein